MPDRLVAVLQLLFLDRRRRLRLRGRVAASLCSRRAERRVGTVELFIWRMATGRRLFRLLRLITLLRRAAAAVAVLAGSCLRLFLAAHRTAGAGEEPP